MAELSTIARPYAEAAFAAASEGGDVAAWSDALTRLVAFSADSALQAAISDPRVPVDKLVALLTELLGQNVPPKFGNFITVLAENGRLQVLSAVEEQFRELRAEKEGSADATIISAFPLDDGALAKLVASLEKRFKRRIRPQVSVDASLIGGVTVRVGDEVIDASVRGKLAQMDTALRN
ncbi:MAG: F0F1 ATP synthase subunit delta [Burkholderiales bacterium]|nr:F0F1 ATP synthase subunit delta [Burkholderiales bacterium]